MSSKTPRAVTHLIQKSKSITSDWTTSWSACGWQRQRFARSKSPRFMGAGRLRPHPPTWSAPPQQWSAELEQSTPHHWSSAGNGPKVQRAGCASVESRCLVLANRFLRTGSLLQRPAWWSMLRSLITVAVGGSSGWDGRQCAACIRGNKGCLPLVDLQAYTAKALAQVRVCMYVCLSVCLYVCRYVFFSLPVLWGDRGVGVALTV